MTAERFLAEGAKVVLNGRREAVLVKTAATLDPSGERIAIAVGDISRLETAKQLVMTATRLTLFTRWDAMDSHTIWQKPFYFYQVIALHGLRAQFFPWMEV